MSRQHSEALFTGPTIVVTKPASKRIGSGPAQALQQVYYLSRRRPEGWVDLTVDQWGGEFGCDGSTASRTLARFVKDQLVDAKDLGGRMAYRPNYPKLLELAEQFDQTLTPKAFRAALQVATPSPLQDAMPGPDQERDSPPVGTAPGHSLENQRTTEVRRKDLEEEESQLAELSTPVVAREVDRNGGGGGEGEDYLHQHRLKGLAPKWSVDHALYVLAKVGSPVRCKGLVHEMVQEALHELAHTDDTRKWAAEFAPDLPQWAVAKLLEHLRGAGDAERERMQARLVALAWKKQNEAAA